MLTELNEQTPVHYNGSWIRLLLHNYWENKNKNTKEQQCYHRVGLPVYILELIIAPKCYSCINLQHFIKPVCLFVFEFS